MPEVNSTLVTGLASSLSSGPGLTIPDLLLPTINLPFPLAAVATAAGMVLVNVPASAQCSSVINHGASLSGRTNLLAQLDKGLWRINGNLGAMTFGGIAPSSAAPYCAEVSLEVPGATARGPIARVGHNGVDPFRESFDIIIHLTQNTWNLYLSTTLTTGAGQSIGAWACVNVSRLA